MIAIGLMSGTSKDGIDVAMLETDGTPNHLKELGHTSITYDPYTQQLLNAAEYVVKKHEGNMAKVREDFLLAAKEYFLKEFGNDQFLSRQDFPQTFDAIVQYSTDLHIQAVKKLLKELAYDGRKVDVIGYHGQALFHRPSKGISIIIGLGQYLADQLGIAVVNDFRSRDINHGGQGAPFAPLYHQALALRDKKIPLAVVNCGGIANITLIKNDQACDLIGFDTGPGNGLLDRLVRQRSQGKKTMDENGAYGKKGKVHETVLKSLYEKALIKEGKNYFSIKPPKSLDINDMQIISELDSLSLEDACATLAAFTADSIVNSLDILSEKLPTHWILTGGGWKNPVIRQELETRLKQKWQSQGQIQTASEAGWNSQALEAQIFAYFAVRSLKNQALSFPNTTGVPTPLSGGRTYLPASGASAKVRELIEENQKII